MYMKTHIFRIGYRILRGLTGGNDQMCCDRVLADPGRRQNWILRGLPAGWTARAKMVTKEYFEGPNMGTNMAPKWHPDGTKMLTKSKFVKLFHAFPHIDFSSFFGFPNHEKHENLHRKRSNRSLSEDLRQVSHSTPIWLPEDLQFGMPSGTIDGQRVPQDLSKLR